MQAGVRLDAETEKWNIGSDSSVVDTISGLPMQALDLPPVPLVLKADTEGSMNALKHSLKTMEDERARVCSTIRLKASTTTMVLRHYSPSAQMVQGDLLAVCDEVPSTIHVPLGLNVYEEQLLEAGVDYAMIDACFENAIKDVNEYVFDADDQPLYFPLGRAVQYIRRSGLQQGQ